MDSRNDYDLGTTLMDDVTHHQGSGGFGWNMFLFAVAVAMIAVNWGFLRPASRQLALMQHHIDALERNVKELTRQHGSAQRAVDLLALLAEQGRQSEQAASGLEKIQQLHQQLLAEAEQLPAANSAVSRLSSLRQDVVRSAGLIEQTRETLSATSDLQQRLVSSANQLRDADAALGRVSDMRTRLLQSVGKLEEAKPLVAKVDQVHQALVDSASLAQDAQSVTDDFVLMSKKLSDESGQTQRSQLVLDDLLDIRQKLDAQAGEMELSHATLDNLVQLKEDVLVQSENLTAAIETLERTVDMTQQYQQAAKSFDELRRWLTEVVLLEPTLRRAMQTLEPITELGNLRHISREELLQAAQVVRDMRRVEVAKRSFTVQSVPEVATSAEGEATRQ